MATKEEARRELARRELERRRASKPGPQPIDASTVYVDEMGFGLPGKAAAGLNALAQRGIAMLPGESPFEGKSVGELYDMNRGGYVAGRKQYAEENPVANTAATIGGAVHGGMKIGKLLEKGFQVAAPRAVAALGDTFAGKMLGDAVLGAGQGAATAYGHDEDIGTGALVGGVSGAAARPFMALGGSLLNSVGGMIGIGNHGRARSAVAEALARSGKSADDVVDDLTRATADGQDVYTVADALGNPGQRMLSGIVRSPGDERAAVVEALSRRQAGQGDRLSNALAEGFAAPDTALQRKTALEAGRDMLADVNYDNARSRAGAVDISGAIRAADDILRPGVNKIMSPASGLADDSTDALLNKYRARMTNGQEVLTDFNEVLKLKSDIGDEAKELARRGLDKKAGALGKLSQRLDAALEQASPEYRAANDAFRAQSKTMEAVDLGTSAASGRVRSADSIQAFGSMQPGEQMAFRAGYVDPLIAKVEAGAMSPTTNKARALITPKTGEEFPAFAIPQRANKMGNRIAREQRMFETANAVLGGSKTADNLADMMDVQSFDPSMLGALATGNFKGAALQGLTRAVQGVQGRNTQTRDMIAKALMTASPQQAKTVLDQAVKQGQISSEVRNAVVRALIGTSNASMTMAN